MSESAKKLAWDIGEKALAMLPSDEGWQLSVHTEQCQVCGQCRWMCGLFKGCIDIRGKLLIFKLDLVGDSGWRIKIGYPGLGDDFDLSYGESQPTPTAAIEHGIKAAEQHIAILQGQLKELKSSI